MCGSRRSLKTVRMTTQSFPGLRRAARALVPTCAQAAAVSSTAASAGRRAAWAAAWVLLASSENAATQISSVIPTPEIVPAGGTVRTAIAISDDNGNPIGAPGT